jgi:general secretion pathway protein N
MNGLQLTTSQRLPALLMAVTALWALIFAVAGLAGLAGRYSLHPDDPALVPALPALDLSRARSPLQPIETYADIGERTLFNPDRRPLPPPRDEKAEAMAGADEGVADDSPLDVALTSVILTPQLRIAIVTDNRSGKSQSLKPGDALEGEQSGWSLKELEPRKAVFANGGQLASVDLRVFDGTGGQAPVAAAAQPKDEAGQARDDGAAPAGANEQAEQAQDVAKAEAMAPQERAEMIRRRIEERRRQMREEAERANRR